MLRMKVGGHSQTSVVALYLKVGRHWRQSDLLDDEHRPQYSTAQGQLSFPGGHPQTELSKPTWKGLSQIKQLALAHMEHLSIPQPLPHAMLPSSNMSTLPVSQARQWSGDVHERQFDEQLASLTQMVVLRT